MERKKTREPSSTADDKQTDGCWIDMTSVQDASMENEWTDKFAECSFMSKSALSEDREGSYL